LADFGGNHPRATFGQGKAGRPPFLYEVLTGGETAADPACGGVSTKSGKPME